MLFENKNKEGQMESGLKALIIYWSATGNTEKVANAIRKGLEKENVKPIVKKVAEAAAEAAREELYAYDLVFFGCPSYECLPPEPVLHFIKEKWKHHRERGDIKLCAPKVPGKTAVPFCTYSGPHTGINETIPAGKYVGQFFEHLGFEVAREWYVVGEFHGREANSTRGKLGDIRGRPNEQDLAKVEQDVCELVRYILARRPVL